MQAEVKTRDGVTLHVREWPRHPGAGRQDTTGTILIVHGLGEHSGRYGHVAAFLNARGWRVIGYDQRGHGQSGGARGRLADGDDLLFDLATVIDAARAGPVGTPDRLVLLGHSLGGLVVARLVAGRLEAAPPAWSRAVEALVLSSPALGIGMTAAQRVLLAVLGRLAPDLPVGTGLGPDGLSRDADVVRRYRTDPLVHDRIAARLARFMVAAGECVLGAAPRWNLPTCLLYAGSDRCVPPAGSAAFAAAAPRDLVEARAFPDLFHEIYNEPEQAEVLSVLAAWLDRLDVSNPRMPP